MGTRSVTIILDVENKELCRIYRQFDGYPEGHGVELAKLCDVTIVNGIRMDETVPIANGMGDLAAQVIQGLKKDHAIGGIYLEPPNGEISDWVEYIYTVKGEVGNAPEIDCHTKTGPFPNIQTEEGLVFTGTAKQWLEKYQE